MSKKQTSKKTTAKKPSPAKKKTPATKRSTGPKVSKHQFGWIPDLPDQRDFRYAAPPPLLMALPPRIDLRPGCPPVYNQGRIGSCTANGLAAAFQFGVRKLAKPDFLPSRLFIYYNERVLEHSVPSDRGAYIRDGIKTMVKQGSCAENLWTYDDTPADPLTGLWPTNAKPRRKPPAAAYTNALGHQVLEYLRLDHSLDQMRGCLASGYPFVFGFTVYTSFSSAAVAQSGVVNLPAPAEHVIGGHAVLAVGYDDATQRFLVRNSWGAAWGQAGYFTMPYAYLTNPNLADDFWTIRVVE